MQKRILLLSHDLFIFHVAADAVSAEPGHRASNSEANSVHLRALQLAPRPLGRAVRRELGWVMNGRPRPLTAAPLPVAG